MNLRWYPQQLWNALSTLKVYPFLVRQSFKLSLAFFILSYVWLSTIATAQVIFRDFPHAENQVNRALEELQSRYPDSLAIEWNGTRLVHSNDQPIRVPYPEHFPPQEYGLPPVLGFITNETITADAISTTFSDRSLFIATDTMLFVSDLQGSWNSVPLTDTPGFTKPFRVVKKELPSFISSLKQEIVATFNFLKVVTAVVFPIGFILHRLWTLLIDSLLVFGLLRFNGVKLSYGKAFQLSMHLLVVAEIVNQAGHLLYSHLELPLLSLTFWLILVLLIITQRTALAASSYRETPHQ